MFLKGYSRGCLAVFLLLPLVAVPDTFDCSLNGVRHSAQLTTTDSTVVLQMAEWSVTLSPVQYEGAWILFSALGPGADDERLVTYRMLRFDTGSGRLDYIQHIPEFRYLRLNCAPR